ncbi:MAG: DUF2752 domain-containing protein [Erysipelotrichaceae bacterium]|nr:DUF2752 domain-containing protein [Erysipelotrichaceae bacterium]
MKKVILLLIVVSLLYVFDIHCIFRTIFQIPCPTCGMTRAWIALCKGNLQQAMNVHPLFCLGPIVVMEVIFYDSWKQKRWFSVMVIMTGVLFFLVYIIRLKSMYLI